MRAESPIVTNHFDARRNLDSVMDELDSIARLLYAVGLTKLGERIDFCQPLLSEAREGFAAAFDQMQTDSLRYSQETVGGLLSLALHGCLKPAESPLDKVTENG